MSTALSHNRTVPLWGFIVIIAVGSVLILGAVIMALRYYIINQNSDGDSIRNDTETVRRVTVRRGRMVPQSHYMSLTGSRFGVGTFGDDSRSGARSKSPFEWWNNAHMRSNSQMSEKRSASNLGRTPEPILTGDTPRKQAPSQLRTAASFESMSEKPPLYTFPSKPALAHSSPLTTNFSRPAPTTRPSGIAASINSSLPQIVEFSPHQSFISSRQSKQSVAEKVTRSPHQSMISSRQSKQSAFSYAVSELEAPDSPASLTGFNSRSNSHVELSSAISSSEPPFDHHPAVFRQRSQSRIPRPVQSTDRTRSKSLPRCPRPANDGYEQNVPPRRPSATQFDRKMSSDKSNGMPRSPHRSTSTLNSHTSSAYRGPGDADHVTGQLSNASLQALPQVAETPDISQAYWESRADLQPVRRKSQKGNVLRKKSLKRAERTSLIS